MQIKIKGVNISKLHDDALCGYTLVGDASQLHIRQNTAWCCVVLDSTGSGEVLYGLTANTKEDTHSAELQVYANTLRSLKQQMPEKPRYRERIHIITDSRNLHAQFTSGSSNRFTEGQWEEIRRYEKTHFDIFMNSMSRDANELLLLADRVCRVVQGKQKGIHEAVKYVIEQALPKLQ